MRKEAPAPDYAASTLYRFLARFFSCEEAIMQDDHPTVEHVAQMRQIYERDCFAFFEQYTNSASNARSFRLAYKPLANAYAHLVMTVQMLDVTIHRLAEIQHLARVCAPDVLHEQLQDVLDDQEFDAHLYECESRYYKQRELLCLDSQEN